jgi:hypothetical protein
MQTLLYYNCKWKLLPEDEHSGSKRVEDTVKRKNVSLTKMHFVGLHYTSLKIRFVILHVSTKFFPATVQSSVTNYTSQGKKYSFGIIQNLTGSDKIFQ